VKPTKFVINIFKDRKEPVSW